MALVINTNVASLNSQRQLVSSGAELDRATERLASGKRINSAKDDAAGLAISNRLTSQIRGLDQAVRNANDGVSLIQTAEGALQESTNILQRMRELSIQSANGIYTDADRQTLDAELQQLVSELDRIAETTSFNGQSLLDGTLGQVDLQVGSEANQNISLSIEAMDSKTLGLGSTSSDLSGQRTADLTDAQGAGGSSEVSFGDGDILINGQTLSAFDGTTDNLQDIVDDINTNIDGVSASAFNVVQADTVGTGSIANGDTLTISVLNVADGSQTDFVIGGTDSDATNISELAEEINTRTGGLVDATVDDGGRLVLSNDTGAGIGLSFDQAGSGTATLDSVLGISAAGTLNQGGFDVADVDVFATGADEAALFTGALSLSSDDGSTINITTGAAGTASDLSNLGFVATTGGDVQGAGLSSVAQGTALAAGDLTINGVNIAATTAAQGLQGKVDNINAVTDQTGVVASVSAQQSYSYDTSITPVEVQGNAAYSAPTTGYGQLSFGPTAAAFGGADDFSTTDDGFSFDVLGMDGNTDTVNISVNVTSQQVLVDEINSQLAAGSSQVEAYVNDNSRLAFRDTTGNGGNAGTITVSNFVAEADYVANSGTGSANSVLGFDIEDLAGSGGSFTNSGTQGAAFNINGTRIDLADYQEDDGTISATEVATAVNAQTANTGVTAYVNESDVLSFQSDEAFTLADDANASGFIQSLDGNTNLDAGTKSTPVTSGSLQVNGFEVTGISLTDLDAAVSTINGQQANTGVVASIDDNGQLQLSGNSSITLNVGNTNGLAVGSVLGVNFVDSSGGANGVIDTQTVLAGIKLDSISDSSTLSVNVTSNGATATGLKDLNTDLSGLVTGSAISNINIGTQAGAQAAIGSIDNALSTISDARSDLGAVNNRLDFTVSNLANVSEKTSAARSRITDTDFAAETAALSRAQVLQQASSAMLAQSNARPQQVLSLLQ